MGTCCATTRRRRWHPSRCRRRAPTAGAEELIQWIALNPYAADRRGTARVPERGDQAAGRRQPPGHRGPSGVLPHGWRPYPRHARRAVAGARAAACDCRRTACGSRRRAADVAAVVRCHSRIADRFPWIGSHAFGPSGRLPVSIFADLHPRGDPPAHVRSSQPAARAAPALGSRQSFTC